ncbi:succinylglutamate-semialdehyde dehydrogenase [Sphingorhabdus sp. 109]|uniref:succinylglutamate-semialdehyde dehydrogenase n=1 Tax=Sphingorhabdus sp. 109 TaxID=2653173 RepID=UPI0012EF3355|nr:succinylglutamate-semialdehyde dehydrogenase [Sphingorhabdus sp. 109]VWX57585.1 N-succinylglutamate 5-semialdehyde dehydrogenase [Sphingorhabdus sp. 109]
MSDLISIEPATGATLWTGTSGNPDAAVASARAAWPGWAATALVKRIEAVRRYANRIRTGSEELAELISRETGKPLWEARTEVESVVNKVDISVRAFADRTPQRQLPSQPDTRAALRHKPHGVLAVLGPYNFPAHLPNGHIVPALIAGNTIVFKPSEKTPAVGQYLMDAFDKAGMPAGVVNIVHGGPAIGKQLTANDELDGVLFTGSAHTGIALNRQFASRPDKILALEMGGNNPIIAWDTSDIHSAAVLIVQSAFLSAGQRCSAASRLIVKDDLYERIIKEVKRITDRLIIDEPFASPAPFMGPVIDNETADGLTESFLALMSHGGKPIKHMARPVAELPFLTPGIIDVTQLEERPDIELFGPILQVVRVADFEEAIAEANNTRYGLSAALIGGTAKHYDQFWSSSRAGIVNWNKMTVGASSEAPFGGIGLSGNHRPSAYYAADYCAYPVVSMEAEKARARIGIGLKDDINGEEDGSPAAK